MKDLMLTTIAAFMMLLSFPSTELHAQDAEKGVQLTANVQVIQFHSEHRCKTCLKIEALTAEALKSFPEVPFRLVNVDDKANEKLAAQFEATGTALVLYDGKLGKKMDLTDFAFMNAHDDEKFVGTLKKYLESFVK
ncbi:MAG: nitrophenyl compound nitroreductase subunit ArsF family protein [Flavobacteriales bacterium]|nr:nitrophenyl compound nitroreductase subunit ArsF family protein [Flavobacteriales bacterium]